MKSFKKILIPIACAAVAVCFLAPARAQDPKDIKIATFDFSHVYLNYWETKQLFSALGIKKKQHDQVIEEKRSSWRKLKTEVEKIEAQLGDPVISDQKKNDLRKEGAEKFALMRKIEQEAAEYAQLAENDLQALDARKRREIIEKIRRVIEQKAREHSYSLVLDISGLNSHGVPTVLFSDRRTEMTDDVLKALNANAPIAQPEPPAPAPVVPGPAAPEKAPEKTPEPPKVP